MTIIARTQVIKAPVEKVFRTVVDGGDFAAWNPTIRSSRRLDNGEIGNGTRFEWDLRGFGKVVQELWDFEWNKQVRIVPHIKMLAGGHRFRLSPKRTPRGSTTN